MSEAKRATEKALEIMKEILKIKIRKGKKIGYQWRDTSIAEIQEKFENEIWVPRTVEAVRNEIRSFVGLKVFYWGWGCTGLQFVPIDPVSLTNRAALYADRVVFYDPVHYVLKRDLAYTAAALKQRLLRVGFVFKSLEPWVEEGLVSLYTFPVAGSSEYQSIEKSSSIDSDSGFERVALSFNHLSREQVVEKFRAHVVQEHDARISEPLDRYLTHLSARIVNSALAASQTLAAVPLTDLTWRYEHLRWKLSQSTQLAKTMLNADARVLSVIEHIPLRWLDNIPFEHLKNLREDDRFDDLRDFFRSMFSDLQHTPGASEFDEKVKEYAAGIGDKLRDVDRAMKRARSDLKAKLQLATGVGILTGLATAGLSLADISAIYKTLAALGTTVTGGIITGEKLYDIFKEYVQERNKIRYPDDVTSSAVYLLWDMRRRAN